MGHLSCLPRLISYCLPRLPAQPHDYLSPSHDYLLPPMTSLRNLPLSRPHLAPGTRGLLLMRPINAADGAATRQCEESSSRPPFLDDTQLPSNTVYHSLV